MAIVERADRTFSIGAGLLTDDGVPLDKIDYGKTAQKVVVPVRGQDTQDVYFDLGIALLRGLGRQSLREFCAKELAWLHHPGSRILIVGHADRLDTPERNIELSELRAKNALQALKDILGPKLALAPEALELRWLGEEVAKSAGLPDGRPNPQWRKVDVYMDGRHVLAMWGEA
jgi:outer membrane protein OmpA-like peptidoglycan-associated protein